MRSPVSRVFTSFGFSTVTTTSKGATFTGQMIPLSSWFASTTAARVRPTPMPYEPITSGCDLPSSPWITAPSFAL